jgi:formylglycine-generating enzyme required for sulfatase activity
MPPRYLRKASPTRLKPCAEFTVETCDTAPADQCCGALPCKLCLEWETYEDGISYGSATFAGTSWTGTVGGHAFVSYWEREILPDIVPPVSNNSIGMSFAPIGAATYTMGSPVSEPGRDTNESEESKTVEAFALSSSQVTQAQYLAVRAASPSHFTGTVRPVEMVSYTDAQAFCAALSALPAEIAMGRSYRLPTEAEWECACRAGTTTAYSFGADPADLPTYGWFATNSGAETHDVLLKSANTNSLYDMHGNVWEWAQNSKLDAVEGEQVIRGGGWNSTAAECRSASRVLIAESTTRNDIGFRVVMVRSPIPQFGECEYIVTLDDEEVYRATCYEGASCRNPSGDVDVSTAYLQGTLRWSKFDPRELALMVDPDTGCRDFFCGDCRCSCRSLCVDVREVVYSDFIDTYSGELLDTAYSECDPPVWAGTVGNFTISLALGRDDYGNCIVTPTVDGEEGEAVAVTGCADMSGTVELYDGSSFTFRCKQCDCAEVIGDCICTRPMGPTLRLVWGSGNGGTGEFLLYYGMQNEPTITCAPWSPGPFPGYRGSETRAWPLPMGGSRVDTLEVILVCQCIGCEYCIYYRWAGGSQPTTWVQANYTVVTCDCPAILDVAGAFDINETWGFQIVDILIYELASNC